MFVKIGLQLVSSGRINKKKILHNFIKIMLKLMQSIPYYYLGIIFTNKIKYEQDLTPDISEL